MDENKRFSETLPKDFIVSLTEKVLKQKDEEFFYLEDVFFLLIEKTQQIKLIPVIKNKDETKYKDLLTDKIYERFHQFGFEKLEKDYKSKKLVNTFNYKSLFEYTKGIMKIYCGRNSSMEDYQNLLVSFDKITNQTSPLIINKSSLVDITQKIDEELNRAVSFNTSYEKKEQEKRKSIKSKLEISRDF